MKVKVRPLVIRTTLATERVPPIQGTTQALELVQGVPSEGWKPALWREDWNLEEAVNQEYDSI